MIKRIILIITISLLYQSCNKEIVIYDSEISADFELGLILRLDGKDCLFDSKTNTLKYSLSKSNLANFSPNVVFQDFSEITFNGNQLSNNSKNNFGNIELHKNYSLAITSRKEIKKFNLIFTDVPLVQIITRDKIENEPKILGKLILNYPEINNSDESWIKIEIRGASSASNDKSSFGFSTVQSKKKLNENPKQFFNMAVNNKWILDALYIDRSKVRNRTSTELWKEMRPNNIGIKSRFVEIFVNNKALGIYSFNENYTESFLSLNNQSVLYTGIDNSETTKFKKISKKPTNKSIWGNWEQKVPDPSTTIEWSEFKKLCKLAVTSSDQEFVTKIGNEINLDNLIDYYLFVNICNGYDNVGKNYFFLKRDATSKFKILVWDLDATWGRDSQGSTITYSGRISNSLFDRLISLNPNNYRTKLKSRWNDLRLTTFSQSYLTSLFNTNMAELDNYSITNENTIWNTDINLTSEQLYINNWIANRLIFLDSYFTSL